MTYETITITPNNCRTFVPVTLPDGTTTYRELSPEEARADWERGRREEAERIAAGGCPHPIEEWEHEYDEDSTLGDAYYCGRCGDLMQVG